jgi:RimJ/RimL family protein N-acetyltransferase
MFAIRPHTSDDFLGWIELDNIIWHNGVASIDIGIGDEANQGRGYGTEAMQLALQFAFNELNLHRVQLMVFSYNDRAIALYEKSGFKREGVQREFLRRDGKRHDAYIYGILRAEWNASHS